MFMLEAQRNPVDGFYAIFCIYHIQRGAVADPQGLSSIFSQYLQGKQLESTAAGAITSADITAEMIAFKCDFNGFI